MKTVCVTGASRGLGRVVAEFFFKSGWQIAVISRNGIALREVAEDLSRKYSRDRSDILVLEEDISKPGTAEKCVEVMKKQWLRLDALVNNAGIQGPIGPFCAIEPAVWEEAFRTLLFAPLDMCRQAVPWMMTGGGGAVVNLSGGGATGPRENYTAYAAAKTALVRTTEILAGEYASYNVTFNALAPGIMPTRLLEETLAAGRGAAGENEYESAKKALLKDDSGTTALRAAECIYALCDQKAPKVSGKLISAVWDSWEDFDRHAEELASSDIYTLRRIAGRDRGMPWADK